MRLSIHRVWKQFLSVVLLLGFLEIYLWHFEPSAAQPPCQGYSHATGLANDSSLHRHQHLEGGSPQKQRKDLDALARGGDDGINNDDYHNIPGDDTKQKRAEQTLPQFDADSFTIDGLPDVPSNSNWVVFDATSGDCERHLMAPPAGWKIIAIVSQHKARAACKAPGCFAVVPKQTADKAMTSMTEIGRVYLKNFAAITVISKGARQILEADCTVNLNVTVKVLRFQRPPKREYGIMYNQTLLFNPYYHFGAWGTVPTAWPRVSGILRAPVGNSRMYYIRDFERVYVKHALSENSPDARKDFGNGKLGGSFDESTPPVFVGKSTYTPAVPVATLYSQYAFWSLFLLPCDLDRQGNDLERKENLRCYVLRQLMQQRLFQELDAFSGQYQLTLTDSAAVKSLTAGSLDVTQLVADLNSWKCNPDTKFLTCLARLADYMVRTGHMDRSELKLMMTWVKYYTQAGGQEPARASETWTGARGTSEVRVALGSIKTRLEEGGPKEELHLKSAYTKVMGDKYCKDTKAAKDEKSRAQWFPLAQWHKPVIKDVVLIIVFNWWQFIQKNIPILETVYRPFFKHMIYCVPGVDDMLLKNNSDMGSHITWVEGLSDTWYYMYECVSMVAQMNIQGVKGYMQIGDDTLVNTWRFWNSSTLDKFIWPAGHTTMRADADIHAWNWYWWPKSRGRSAALKALADIEAISGLSSQEILSLDPVYKKTKTMTSTKVVKTFYQCYTQRNSTFPLPKMPQAGTDWWQKPSKEDAVKFLTNYYTVNRMAGRVKHRAMDFYYVPQTLVGEYVMWSQFFQNHGVLIELALPAIHLGVTNVRDNVLYVKASSVWRDDRLVSYTFYSDTTFFLHPFKMATDLKQQVAREFFCDSYMHSLFSAIDKHIKH